MTLKEQINQDFVNAMKEKNKVKISVLKMLKADILNEEIDRNHKQNLTEQQMIELLSRIVKKQKDTIAEFRRLGKEEQAKQEEIELEILMPYLPKQLNETEIESIVQKTISDLNASSMKDMGKVIKKIKEEYIGQVDMKLVTTLVKKNLL